MRRPFILSCALAVLAASGGTAQAQSATGTLNQGSQACDPATAAASPADCADAISAQVTIAPDAVGKAGAIFVAILPLDPQGHLAGGEGGYATPSGWQVTGSPLPIVEGPLPSEWQHDFTVPGGICAAAAGQGAHHVAFGVFVGYGLAAANAAGSSAPSQASMQALLQEAEATGDPKVVEQVRAAMAPPGAGAQGSAAAATAAADMLKQGTAWMIGRVNCE